MYYALRLTDSPDYYAYPLPINGDVDWQQVVNAKMSLWQASITLPTTPKDHIIVPSFSMTGIAHQYQVSLMHCDSGQENRLDPLLTAENELDNWPKNQAQLSSITAEIDCWHTCETLSDTQFFITIECANPPTNYLLTLTIRKLTLTQALPNIRTVALAEPWAMSQMDAEPKLRKQICSPTSLAMVLKTLKSECSFEDVVERCYDSATKAYGKWPLAIHVANGFGLVGAVEALPSWETVQKILDAQWFIICSIRFEKNTLEGAPLDQSAGHLVVLYGIDATDQDEPMVMIMDPAAKTRGEVKQRYKLAQFSSAWLGHRGGAYILKKPHSDSQFPHSKLAMQIN
jgi:hypothetical protein